MPLPLFIVDAFTDRPFAGNPAAVCLLPAGSEKANDANWMQQVAREMNLSETAYVTPRAEGDFDLRWFTPAVEVDLCGHATLATAHVLWEAVATSKNAGSIRFHTRSGVLGATRTVGRITLDFPARIAEPALLPAGLEGLLPHRPLSVARFRDDVIVELAREEEVRGFTVDFAALAKVDLRALLVTARATTAPYDFVSRFFAPRVGVNEDPVTGSAHCLLTPLWSARLGKKDLTAYQASPRGGVIHVGLSEGRVTLGGAAVTVLRGELTV
ncbi:MAG TPA: PhzF family phenazine biosynthesis protein [Polyangiaceae bacterium]|jgi:PhzF family phenazine biosynthesis protein